MFEPTMNLRINRFRKMIPDPNAPASGHLEWVEVLEQRFVDELNQEDWRPVPKVISR
jgi:hypothetical protein